MYPNIRLDGAVQSAHASTYYAGRQFHLVGTLKKSFVDIINSFLMRQKGVPKNHIKTVKTRFRPNRFLHNIENNGPKYLKTYEYVALHYTIINILFKKFLYTNGIFTRNRFWI